MTVDEGRLNDVRKIRLEQAAGCGKKERRGLKLRIASNHGGKLEGRAK